MVNAEGRGGVRVRDCFGRKTSFNPPACRSNDFWPRTRAPTVNDSHGGVQRKPQGPQPSLVPGPWVLHPRRLAVRQVRAMPKALSS